MTAIKDTVTPANSAALRIPESLLREPLKRGEGAAPDHCSSGRAYREESSTTSSTTTPNSGAATTFGSLRIPKTRPKRDATEKSVSQVARTVATATDVCARPSQRILPSRLSSVLSVTARGSAIKRNMTEKSRRHSHGSLEPHDGKTKGDTKKASPIATPVPMAKRRFESLRRPTFPSMGSEYHKGCRSETELSWGLSNHHNR